MKLTKNFYLKEFLVSSKHPELIKEVSLKALQIDKLYLLCVFGLQPIRDEFGYIQVTSGYRSPLLNKMIGGSKSSQHMRCEAADFICKDAPGGQVYKWLSEYPGEVIYYKTEERFHISLPQLGVKMDHLIKGG